jgi:hypothetical protein
MALTAEQKTRIVKKFIRLSYIAPNQTANANKDDLLAAIDAVDLWTDDNQASYNAALPAPFKTVATSGQKVSLLSLVTEEKAG